MGKLSGALLLVGVVFTATATDPNPVGNYVCTGVQHGKPYAIYLSVQELDQSYELRWRADLAGHPTLVGLGVRDGGYLGVAIVSATGAVGAALYRIGPGRLDGVWTPGDGSLDPETCHNGKAA